jgi:hypothetical protein
MKKSIVNNHHIIYPGVEHPEQEVVVKVRKCEHLLLTRQSWYCRKTVSEGYITALKVFIALNESRAKEL